MARVNLIYPFFYLVLICEILGIYFFFSELNFYVYNQCMFDFLKKKNQSLMPNRVQSLIFFLYGVCKRSLLWSDQVSRLEKMHSSY